MRIKVAGNCKAEQILKDYLAILGFKPVKFFPSFEINLSEVSETVVIDGVDSHLEQRVVFHLQDLGVKDITFLRGNHKISDREISISYPESLAQLVARSLARAIQEAKPKFLTRKLFLLPLLLLLGTDVQAQQFIYGRAWDSVTL